MTVYEPSGTWPRHGTPRWNDTMDAAKARGWRLDVRTDHGSRYLICPSGDHRLGPIYGTASNTERVAMTYLRQIKRCQHHDPATVSAHVETHLEQGERLIVAAADLLFARDRRAEALELLAEADRLLALAIVDQAEDALNGHELAEWEASDALDRAQDALAVVGIEVGSDGVEGSSGMDEAVVIDVAESHADAAEESLGGLSSADSRHEALGTRLENLRRQIEVLRGQAGDSSARS